MSDAEGQDNKNENVLAIEGPRPPRNLQDLLRYAVEAEGSGSVQHNTLQPLDPDRRRFLEDVLKNLTVDVAKELSDAISTLKSLHNAESEQRDEDEYIEALEKISEFVDNIDAANDFFKLGGFDIFGVCIASSSPCIRWRIADIIALCTQNNPFCQAQAVSMHFITPLLQMVDQDDDNTCKVKAFYAISSIVRDFPPALKQFIEDDGFSVVLRAMQSQIEKLCTKATFFLSTMISKNPELKEIIFQMGFIEQLIALMRGEHSPNHEHLASALLALVENYDEAQNECRRPEFELRLTLENLLSDHSSNEAFQEEMLYVRNLMAVIFTEHHEEER